MPELNTAPVVTKSGHEYGDTGQSGGAHRLAGTARIYFGEGYSQWLDLSAGDFVFVPPFLPHVEANMSTTEELVWLTARTPDNIVVNLPEVDDATLEGYSRP